MEIISGFGTVSYNINDIVKMMAEAHVLKHRRATAIKDLLEAEKKLQKSEISQSQRLDAIDGAESTLFAAMTKEEHVIIDQLASSGRISEPLRSFLLIKAYEYRPLMRPEDEKWFGKLIVERTITTPVYMELGSVVPRLTEEKKAVASEYGQPQFSLNGKVARFLTNLGKECDKLTYKVVIDPADFSRYLQLFFGVAKPEDMYGNSERLYADETLVVRNSSAFLHDMTKRMNKHWREANRP